MVNDKQLAAIAAASNARIDELFDPTTPRTIPTITVGMIRIILEIAGRTPCPPASAVTIATSPATSVTLTAPASTRQNGVHPTSTPTKRKRAPRRTHDDGELLAAVVERLQEIAEDGKMPTQVEYDADRGDLPKANSVYTMTKSSWAELAERAGLAYTPRGYPPRKEREPAMFGMAPFRPESIDPDSRGA